MNANPPRTASSYPGVAVTPLPRGWRSGGHGLPAVTAPRTPDPADPLLAHGGGRASGVHPGEEPATAVRAEDGLATGGHAGEGPAGDGERGEGVPSPLVTAPPPEPEPGEPGPATADPAATPQPETAAPGDPAEATDSREGEVDDASVPTGVQATPRRAAAPGEWHGIVLVTGTDTEVGKTISTAAVAAAAQAEGLRVAVIKPGQTGTVTGAPTDAEVVTRLAGPDTVKTLAEYPEPLAPLAAAKVAELPPLELYEVVDAIRAEADKHDLVLVEGAGGLLVPMGLRPGGDVWTFADLATALGASVLVVARAGLGTLNHTALTLEALSRRGVPAKVILGAWPAEPELVHWANLSELVPHLVGALPAGAGSMDPGVFRRSAPGWLTPALHGVLDNWRVWAEEAG
ncbi:hypothetical protein Acy02nite_52210 [Actinoplanes cyaneus]|uniref:ATP-dependent dethiobiotin synthetase BioD n=1 Tax=Actinoplanes cyaneus TaxID=52696 RepID=A0A919M2J9_9ACTN|nr:dethiobiotin synthetase [Actinoplanes cyaneus]GID67340.1 hypothetical protein Acy02nite_52210 [Actinoplanes cyaneus]